MQRSKLHLQNHWYRGGIGLGKFNDFGAWMSCWRFPVEISFRFFNFYFTFGALRNNHPRRPRGSQSSRGKRCDESFQAQAEEPLDTDSHRTISKRSSEWWLLIGHKKCFLLLCPIEEQHLLSSFREFVHDATTIDLIAACLAHAPNKCTQSGNFQFDINNLYQNTGCLYTRLLSKT